MPRSPWSSCSVVKGKGRLRTHCRGHDGSTCAGSCYGQDGAALAKATGGQRVETLAEAVDIARDSAPLGATILLAPACASFDQFTDYAERGRVFASLAAEGGGDS